MQRVQLAGQRFGRLVALRDMGRAPDGHRQWLCRCDCGAETTVRVGHLRSVAVGTQSCGCLRREANVTHGLTHHGRKHPLYGTWARMWQRCRDPRVAEFEHYGGRGISVCERWRDFAAFLADVGEKPSPKHSLDRINNDLGYSPTNVRWATQTEQVRNARPRKRSAASATLRNWHARRARP